VILPGRPDFQPELRLLAKDIDTINAPEFMESPARSRAHDPARTTGG
jgi:hypothetical protein